MLDLLWLVFIAPIEFCMQAVFDGGYALTHSCGLALIGVSLVVNTALLPIYNRAESWQEEERALKKRMEPKEKMIRRSFRGQERFTMLSTLYRQSGYSPLMSLRASIGLLLQIPFFLAAYLLLSQMPALEGVGFGPIRNLGTPDGLLSLGGLRINVLPILMTAVNLCSAFFYSHSLSRRDKIQLYGMAAIFLVLLYNSPAGLTFYWTLNNIYSLCRNIVEKDWMRRAGWERTKQRLAGARDGASRGARMLAAWALGLRVRVAVIYAGIGAAGLLVFAYGVWKHGVPSLAMSTLLFAGLAALGILGREKFPLSRRLPASEALAMALGALGFPYLAAKYGLKTPDPALLVIGALLLCVAVWALTLGKTTAGRAWDRVLAQKEALGRLFLPAGAVLGLLAFVYAPAQVFSSDPGIFGMSLEDFVTHRLGTFFGILICLAVIYECARPLRWLLGSLCTLLALAALVFCFVVTPDTGNMNAFILQHPEALARWYNSAVDAAVFLLALGFFVLAVYFRKPRLLASPLYAALVVLMVMTGVNLSAARDALAPLAESAHGNGNRPESREIPQQVKDFFTFTRTGKNIVVVMLDQFTGGNMNQILEQYPGIRSQLDGFTWYEDTVTAGSCTMYGKPPILGGEDALPINLNKDASKSLKEKIARSYAKLFAFLAAHNFQISVYDGFMYYPHHVKQLLPESVHINLFYHNWDHAMWPEALDIWEERQQFKSAFVPDFHHFFDAIGIYLVSPLRYRRDIYNGGSWWDTIPLKNININHAAINLANLEIPLYASSVSAQSTNRFMYFISILSHAPWAIDENGLPSPHGAADASRNPEKDGLSEEHIRAEYFALRKLVDWFDWMKKNDVYKNTQIILVSDHGRGDSASIVKMWGGMYRGAPHGLLLVKEYGAEGELVVNRDTQMANWDVPVLIENGLAGDDAARTFPWNTPGRKRPHAHEWTKWMPADHPENAYTINEMINIEGPLYEKESWKKVLGWWPPDK